MWRWLSGQYLSNWWCCDDRKRLMMMFDALCINAPQIEDHQIVSTAFTSHTLIKLHVLMKDISFKLHFLLLLVFKWQENTSLPPSVFLANRTPLYISIFFSASTRFNARHYHTHTVANLFSSLLFNVICRASPPQLTSTNCSWLDHATRWPCR